MGELRLELREDGRLHISIAKPEENPLALDAAAVSRLIESLGELRAAMNPAVAEGWAPAQRVAVIPDPCWYTEPEMMQGNSLLHIRDARYGWLHYVIPKAEAKKLAEFLNRQATAPFPEVPLGLAN